MIAERPSTVIAFATTAIAVVATSAMGFHRGASGVIRPTSSQEAIDADLEAKRVIVRALENCERSCRADYCICADRRHELPRPATQGAQVLAHADDALSEFDGCFDEWSARHPSAEASLTINIDVDHYGNALAHTDHERYDGGLALCLETAMEGVRFPAGPDDLDLEVRVTWSEGLLILSPIVVGHRMPEYVDVDPYRESDLEQAKAKLRALQRRRAELEWRLGEAKLEYARHAPY